MRICVISENMSGHPDEGIRNWGLTLLRYCDMEHRAKAVTVGQSWGGGIADVIVPVRSNRLFLSPQLCSTLREFRPDLVFYISPSCAKTAALLRARVLKAYVPEARIFVVALQPVEYNGPERRLLPLLAPDGVFVQSPKSMESLRGLPCPVRFLPSGVDTSRFVPKAQSQKRELRQQYGVDEGAFVMLHVGHINHNRNIRLLNNLTRLRGVQVILVGSTSTPHDEGLASELAQAGVRVIREYLPHIEELYQLANAYLFPVISEDAAIGVPLSVLEAMACNLPVITTRFGGLPLMFQEGKGFLYFDCEDELPELIARVKQLQNCSTRRIVEPYDWTNVARMLIASARGGNNGTAWPEG